MYQQAQWWLHADFTWPAAIKHMLEMSKFPHQCIQVSNPNNVDANGRHHKGPGSPVIFALLRHPLIWYICANLVDISLPRRQFFNNLIYIQNTYAPEICNGRFSHCSKSLKNIITFFSFVFFTIWNIFHYQKIVKVLLADQCCTTQNWI